MSSPDRQGSGGDLRSKYDPTLTTCQMYHVHRPTGILCRLALVAVWRAAYQLEAATGRGWSGSSNRTGRPAQRGRTGRGKRSAQRQRRTTTETSGVARRGLCPQRRAPLGAGARERALVPPLNHSARVAPPGATTGKRGKGRCRPEGGRGRADAGYHPHGTAYRRPDATPTASAGRRACARPPTGRQHPLTAASIIDQAAGQGEPRRRARRRSSQRARPVTEDRLSPTW